MADQAADYPVYEKDGNTQIAATPQREVQLQFDGWTKREKAAASGGDGPSEPPKSKTTK